MKNAKRILALAAAILLFGMYLSTLIFALIGSPHSIDLLWALLHVRLCFRYFSMVICWYSSLPGIILHLMIQLTAFTATARMMYLSCHSLMTRQAMIPYKTQRASDFLRDRLILFSYVFFHLL